MKIKKLSIIIIYYQEGIAVLLEAIKKIRFFLNKRKIPFEIIVSQNGDFKKIKLEIKDCKFIYTRSAGLGIAIKNGLIQAYGDSCYITSPEIPFHFTDLKQMINKDSSFDLIIGSKLHPQSIYKINPLRLFISITSSRLTQLLIPNFTIQDPNGTFFGKTQIMRKISGYINDKDFFFCTKFTHIFLKNNYKINEVPVIYIKKDNKSSVKINHMIMYFFKLIYYSLKERFYIFFQ